MLLVTRNRPNGAGADFFAKHINFIEAFVVCENFRGIYFGTSVLSKKLTNIRCAHIVSGDIVYAMPTKALTKERNVAHTQCDINLRHIKAFTTAVTMAGLFSNPSCSLR